MQASSVVVLVPNHAVSGAPFIVEQLRKWMKRGNPSISWITMGEVADFRQLLNDSRYDRILVSPGARSKVPADLHSSSRILLLQMDLDPEALEITRIRAGVIV